MHRSAHGRRQSLMASFAAALDGMCYALVTERNTKIHFVGACLVLVWNLCVRPPLPLVTATIVAVCLVFSAELVNTSVERLVDLAAGGRVHSLAKFAKDVAAAAVLMVSVGAVAVGGYVAVAMLPWHFRLWSLAHLGGALVSLVGLIFLFILALCSWMRRKLYIYPIVSEETNHGRRP
jgi:diacylglycerol kinase